MTYHATSTCAYGTGNCVPGTPTTDTTTTATTLQARHVGGSLPFTGGDVLVLIVLAVAMIVVGMIAMVRRYSAR